MGRVEVGGGEVALFETGDPCGAPVLLLHGNPDSHDVWDGLADRLARKGRRCLAPDLPGFGDSALPPEWDASLESGARWVRGVLDAARVDAPVDLVVHDVGGPMGLAFATRHPSAVRRVVIGNTIFQADYHWHFWARVWRTPLLGELSFAALNYPLFRREMRRGSPRIPDAYVRSAYEKMRGPAMRRAVLRWYRATDVEAFRAWEDPWRAVAREHPTLVIWGDRDPFIPSTNAERFGAAKVTHLPDAGHWAMLEEPEAFGAAVEAHFA